MRLLYVEEKVMWFRIIPGVVDCESLGFSPLAGSKLVHEWAYVEIKHFLIKVLLSYIDGPIRRRAFISFPSLTFC